MSLMSLTPPPQQNGDVQSTLASCWSPCFLKVVCILRLLHQAKGYMFMLMNHYILGGVCFFRKLSDICFSGIIMCLCVCPCLFIWKADLKTSPAIIPYISHYVHCHLTGNQTHKVQGLTFSRLLFT